MGLSSLRPAGCPVGKDHQKIVVYLHVFICIYTRFILYLYCIMKGKLRDPIGTQEAESRHFQSLTRPFVRRWCLMLQATKNRAAMTTHFLRLVPFVFTVGVYVLCILEHSHISLFRHGNNGLCDGTQQRLKLQDLQLGKNLHTGRSSMNGPLGPWTFATPR